MQSTLRQQDNLQSYQHHACIVGAPIPTHEGVWEGRFQVAIGLIKGCLLSPSFSGQLAGLLEGTGQMNIGGVVFSLLLQKSWPLIAPERSGCRSTECTRTSNTHPISSVMLEWLTLSHPNWAAQPNFKIKKFFEFCAGSQKAQQQPLFFATSLSPARGRLSMSSFHKP